MKRWKISWDALLVMSVVIVAGVCSQPQQVALAEDEGRVVSISPDANAELPLEAEEGEEVAPSHWIGIQGRGVQSPVLRTHLQLAEDMGVVIESVVDNSPAKKAGLQKYDIILRANGDAVHGMEVLQEQVREHQEKPIELKIIRLGKEETVVVVPEERPQEFARVHAIPSQRRQGKFNLGGDGFGGGGADVLRQLMQQLQRDGGLQGGVRMFGPGMFLDGNQQGQNAIPDGVSYSITRKSGEPTRITIRRGGESWEIVGDDAEALAQLPEDLQPFAKQAMQQGQGGQFRGMQFDFEKGLEGLLPGGLGAFGGGGVIQAPRQDFSLQEDELSKRLEQMEKDLRELQRRLSEEEPALVDDPKIDVER